MASQKADSYRMEAQMRAADARLDEMEAAARARNARAEMDEISGLRAQRDRVREEVAEARDALRGNMDSARQRVDADWTDLRGRITDAHSRYTAWDAARERRFNAHLDEADAALREQGAKDAEVGADVRGQLADARQELRDKAAAAHRSYDAWSKRQTDRELQRELDYAELELEEASSRYMVAREAVSQRG